MFVPRVTCVPSHQLHTGTVGGRRENKNQEKEIPSVEGRCQKSEVAFADCKHFPLPLSAPLPRMLISVPYTAAATRAAPTTVKATWW